MVSIQFRPQFIRIILTPNRSLSWQKSKWVLAFIGGFCLSIALVWSLLGAWFILPFAGLEIGLLALVMYLVSAATYQRQEICVYQDSLRVRKGRYRKTQQWQLNRHNTSLTWPQCNHPEDARLLLLSDGSQSVRIGEFLNLEDQNLLIKECQQLGIAIKEHIKPVKIDF